MGDFGRGGKVDIGSRHPDESSDGFGHLTRRNDTNGPRQTDLHLALVSSLVQGSPTRGKSYDIDGVRWAIFVIATSKNVVNPLSGYIPYDSRCDAVRIMATGV